MKPSPAHLVLGPLFATLAAAPAAAQFPPDSFTNLRVLPADIRPGELVSMMAGFTRALGVRCTHCHVGVEGQPLATYEFASDDKPAKLKARVMMRMLTELNGSLLASLPERASPPVRVECATCHRGVREPRPLQDVLLLAYEAGGLDSTVAAYRGLRERYYGAAAYDFGEVTLADVAARVEVAGSLADAEAMHRLNVEQNPGSNFARRMHARVALLLAFTRDGAEAGGARYHELRAAYPPQALPESLLNQVGYALLGTDRVAEAVAAFRINAERFPDSWNVHDSLGEGYARQGDVARAIASYQRSLELNPANDNARRALARLRGGG